MTRLKMTALLAAAIVGSTIGASTYGQSAAMMKVDKAMVDGIVAAWQPEPKALAMMVIAKYGLPQEASANRLIWMNNGPWKMSELVNEAIQHDFPKPHHDMFRQTIAWKVPADKFDELADYDGSVIVERTKGEVSARCDKEEANFLALNLAHDIVMGKHSVSEARQMYSEAIGMMKHAEYTKGLMFQAPRGMQGDPDKSTLSSAMAK